MRCALALLLVVIAAPMSADAHSITACLNSKAVQDRIAEVRAAEQAICQQQLAIKDQTIAARDAEIVRLKARVAELEAQVPPPPPPPPPPPATSIPGLGTWQSRMLAAGQRHCDWLKANKEGPLDPALNAVYYDADRVFQQIAAYTGTTTWQACADAARRVYRDRYAAQYNGRVPGYWLFTTGLRMHVDRTGDAVSRDMVHRIAINGAYANDTADLSFLKSYNLMREISYALRAYADDARLGAAPRTQRAAYASALYTFLDQTVTEAWRGQDWQVSPFMLGILAEALIADAEQRGGDARLLPQLTRLADYLWTTWEANGAFRYQINPACTFESFSPAGGGGAVDLNLLIAPLYAYLWKHTGEIRHRDRGDAAFASGAAGAWLDGAKQFNQSYAWSFDYVRWRQ